MTGYGDKHHNWNYFNSLFNFLKREVTTKKKIEIVEN